MNTSIRRKIISLKMEISELLEKGYLREFLSDKAKSLVYNKEKNSQMAIITPDLSPWYDRIIDMVVPKSAESHMQHKNITNCLNITK